MKIFKSTIDKETSVTEDWHDIGKVKMKTGEGVKVFKDSTLKQEIMKMAENGKTRKQIGEELVRRGVKIEQYEKRMEIDEVLKSLEK